MLHELPHVKTSSIFGGSGNHKIKYTRLEIPAPHIFIYLFTALLLRRV